MEIVEPNEQTVAVFWAVAREKVSWTSLENLVGQARLGNIQPPAVQLSAQSEEASRIAAEIAGGDTVELVDELVDGVELPQVGDLMVVCDGHGLPICLAQTTSVEQNGKLVTERVVSLYPPRG